MHVKLGGLGDTTIHNETGAEQRQQRVDTLVIPRVDAR